MKQTNKLINLSRYNSSKINLPTGIYRDERGSVFVDQDEYSKFYNPRSVVAEGSPI
ncbi:hypothetical protein [Apilactobacillus xinyiensis]|uniref:hypothetical protein n=1 Tax=Apilactobacillus xinyiensis TaxID=2841032 RepID=UPI001C7CAE44|nr:hypothetical protein [Apilactobacillus xinyiensis]MCL0329756.1 hypothetical protein [Apilactobacillus xinyiensis]